MLHLLVPQSITPLISAYLVFSLHMPFAPFWPSASIHSFISFSVNYELSPTLLCLFIIIGHDTHTHTHATLKRADLVPEAFLFSLLLHYIFSEIK